MNKILLSTLLLIGIANANAQGINNVPNPAKTETNVFKQSQIEINDDDENFNLKVVNGEMWVFQYFHRFEEYPDVTDDERSEGFLFQIAPVFLFQAGNSFEISGTQIEQAKTTFNKSCFCPDRGFFKITEGTITGIKLNDTTWEINADFIIPAKGELSAGAQKKTLTAIFYVKKDKLDWQDLTKQTSGKIKTTFHGKSKLELKQDESGSVYPKISEGKKWVLEYKYTAPENPDIADDEYSETFTFQIKKPCGKRFKITDLKKANAIFLKSCFCADRGYSKITEGKITGKKIDKNTWEITATYMVGSMQKSFSVQFVE